MKWQNLKDGRCPKCGSMLTKMPDRAMLACSAVKCTFVITEQRCARLISSPPRLRNSEPEDNLARHE